MKILRVLANRLIGIAVVLFVLATVVFIIVRVTPGDPAAVMLGGDATAADVAALRARMGLDAPLRVSGDVTVFEGGDVDREVQRLAELLAGVGEAHRGGFEDGVGGSAGS